MDEGNLLPVMVESLRLLLFDMNGLAAGAGVRSEDEVDEFGSRSAPFASSVSVESLIAVLLLLFVKDNDVAFI